MSEQTVRQEVLDTIEDVLDLPGFELKHNPRPPSGVYRGSKGYTSIQVFGKWIGDVTYGNETFHLDCRNSYFQKVFGALGERLTDLDMYEIDKDTEKNDRRWL